MWQTALIAFGLGLLAGAGVGWFVLQRQLRVVRNAERRARQAERMAEIGSMTGGLAHEIKNPLSTIGLNAQLLSEAVGELDADPEVKGRLVSRLGALRREVERLRGILSDFLEFAGQVRLDRRPTDVREIVSELVDFYTPEAARQGVRLRAEGPSTPAVAAVDVRLVKQALLNLMLNGTQAIAQSAPPAPNGAGPRGELILRTEAVNDESLGRTIKVHVIDTGPGMPDELLAKVFTPYFTTKSGGTGLGLPTARRFIEEHGGRIDVHTAVGKGSDFVIVLPVGEEPPSGATAPPPAR